MDGARNWMRNNIRINEDFEWNDGIQQKCKLILPQLYIRMVICFSVMMILLNSFRKLSADLFISILLKVIILFLTFRVDILTGSTLPFVISES